MSAKTLTEAKKLAVQRGEPMPTFMGPDVDCPECGVERIRQGVSMCSACEVAARLCVDHGLREAHLLDERDAARDELRQKEHVLTLAKERADALQARVVELEEALQYLLGGSTNAAQEHAEYVLAKANGGEG